MHKRIYYISVANVRYGFANRKVLKKLCVQYQSGNYDARIAKELEYMVQKRKVMVFPYEWTGVISFVGRIFQYK